MHVPQAVAGMAIAAAQDWQLELTGSFVIGDKRSDLELADSIAAREFWSPRVMGRISRLGARESQAMFDNFRDAADYVAEVSVDPARRHDHRHGCDRFHRFEHRGRSECARPKRPHPRR